VRRSLFFVNYLFIRRINLARVVVNVYYVQRLTLYYGHKANPLPEAANLGDSQQHGVGRKLLPSAGVVDVTPVRCRIRNEVPNLKSGDVLPGHDYRTSQGGDGRRVWNNNGIITSRGKPKKLKEPAPVPVHPLCISYRTEPTSAQ
jgi:hypothetical protein